MALFVDGNPTTLNELANYESAIIDVAATENIDLTAKARLAALEAGLTIQRFLSVTPGGQQLTLGHVAVTDALKHWHALLTLAATYRDAHFQQLNDRHKYKWKEYDVLAREAARSLFETGLGIVYSPIPKPGLPKLEQTGGPHAAWTYYVRIAWVDARGIEGTPSDVTAMTTMEGTSLTVRAPGAPTPGLRWNLYAGLMDDQLVRQNSVPMEPGSIWTIPSSGLETDGAPVGAGQNAEYFLRHVPMMLRG